MALPISLAERGAQGESRTHWATWTVDLQSTPAPYGTTCAIISITSNKFRKPLVMFRIFGSDFMEKSLDIAYFSQI